MYAHVKNFFQVHIMTLIRCETIVLGLSVCLSVCVCVRLCVCPSAMPLKWHSIVNSQYNFIRGYISPRGMLILKFDSPSTRTTACAATLAVSPKSLKFNISTTNCPIALKYDTGVKHQTVHTQNCH